MIDRDAHQHRPLCVLGSTGSIGVSTLDVARHLSIPVHTLTAHTRLEALAEQARVHGVQRVVCARGEDVGRLRGLLADQPHIEVCGGAAALCEAAGDEHCPTVVTAIVGGAGLEPTLAAVRSGKRVAIANKEPLVMAGELITAEAMHYGATLLPVDSEHSAIFQCLEHHRQSDISQLLLTASGGPFRTIHNLSQVTVEQALNHPNWSMGAKITIDSATLMNKALEVIEAHHLFAIDVSRIEVVVHPQSIIHSLVAFADGSLMAQLGAPDMRTPIQYALTWPYHRSGPVACPDLLAIARLDFETPDHKRFPALELGRHCAQLGGIAPVIFNAANEVAVERFLAQDIRFVDITHGIAEAVDALSSAKYGHSLEDILAADAEARSWLTGWQPR
ncbi:MAG: 1-deoxy-D-xylulose-5-phosphate reductoisomerase [Planctomycetota bacterium]|nr:MAG: 1-deoxy-D-xylulose-5-phosphate reductoisomerase [Planctomycetota bacterium]